jgi:hypothetical protein
MGYQEVGLKRRNGFQRIALNVRPVNVGGQQVAGHGVVTASPKSIAHRTAVLTGDQDFH